MCSPRNTENKSTASRHCDVNTIMCWRIGHCASIRWFIVYIPPNYSTRFRITDTSLNWLFNPAHASSTTLAVHLTNPSEPIHAHTHTVRPCLQLNITHTNRATFKLQFIVCHSLGENVFSINYLHPLILINFNIIYFVFFLSSSASRYSYSSPSISKLNFPRQTHLYVD